MCTAVLERLRTVAFPKGSTLLGPVHVLDLDKAGYIKPHIDSVKVCGHFAYKCHLVPQLVLNENRQRFIQVVNSLFSHSKTAMWQLRDSQQYNAPDTQCSC